MKLTLAAFAIALPVFAQQTTLPGDAATQLLAHPNNAQAQFLAKNAGWQAAATKANALFFKDPSGAKQAAVLGSVTHQDSTTGAWLVNDAALSATTNGWRLDGTEYSVLVRQSGSTQHAITQSYTDYASKHTSTLTFTVPTLSYSTALTLGFNQDGLAWNLTFSSQGFFQIRAKVSKRLGKASHSFPVASSENLTVNSAGQLVGDTHVGLTRAVMIPRFGKPIPCSAWSYAKGAASFTCDDSILKDNQLPYVIDPQSETTLTNNGTYYVDNWNDGQGNSGSDDAFPSFDLTGLPSYALIGSLGCNYNVLDSSLDGSDSVQCSVSSTPPYGATSIACGGAYWPCNSGGGNSTTTTATVDIGINVTNSDSSWGDGATVNDVQLAVYYTAFSPSPGAYGMPMQVSLTADGNYFTFYSGGPVSYSGYEAGLGPCPNCYVSGSSASNVSTPMQQATFTVSGAATLTAVNWAYLYGYQPFGVASATYTPAAVITTGVSPTAGSSIAGQPVTITETVYDTVGASDVTDIYSLLNPSSSVGPNNSGYTTANNQQACYVLWVRPSNSLYLVQDDGSDWYGPSALGSGPALSNSRCTVYPAQSSVNGSGNTFNFYWVVNFAAPFEGSKNVYMYATDGSVASGWQWVGTWTVTAPQPTAAPIFTPAGGIYTTTQSVALSSATPNASIRYTTDGSTPTETHGTVYASPISISAPATVKAIAYETYWLDSAVTAETYYFSNPTGGTETGGAGSGTPPADSGNGVDPRRVGVRALGSYWGDAGENLDTTSGNLNFSNTMIKPFGRGNWTLPFMLSYNSQIWRKDSGGDWLMGEDVGYGMGWKLQMGSLTPVWSTTSTIDHYIFTDASGAEYNLSVNTGGVWTSTEGTYISYDSNANRIYNNDGSYWVMGCTSAGTEQDAGVMYPTLAENANGNQITIAYQAGQGMGTGNTSARISTVTDTRAAYNFTYATLSPGDDIQHLTSIGGEPGESWVLSYTGGNLASPLSGATYGAIELLATLQQVNGPTSPAYFSYNSGAEMTQYTTALGGSISWGYTGNTYSGNVTLREVTSRSMNQGAGSFTNSHALSHPTSCDTAGGSYHACTQILDSGAGSKKIYYASAQSSLILPSEYQETDNNGSTLLLQKNFTWTQNSLSNNWYVGSVATTLNPGGSNAATTSTAQTLDNYGNLTAQNVNDYGSSSVSRSYSLNYVTDATYTSRYLRNLLGTAYVTANNVTTMLVNNGYDGTGLGALQVPKDQWGSTVTLPQHDSAYDTTVTYRGNVTSAWKMGTSTSYAYDIGGNPYKAQDGDLMTVSLATSSSTGGSLPALLTPNSNSNLATGMTYASSFAPTSVTGANGATQSITYDGSNRPSSSTSVDGAVTNYTYTYGPATQTATISTTTNGTTTTQWRTTTYDGFGRTIKVQTGHDSTPADTVNVDTVYGACGCSPLGKVVKVSMPYRQGETEVWTTYTYDGSGRQLTSTVPDGSVTTTSYSGHSVTSTDPAGIWKTNIMDAFGNLTTVYEPDPVSGSPSTGPATYYAYNGSNQLVNVYLTRSGIAQNRSFTYNGSDMLTETTPEAGTVTYTYDNNHHVLTRTDANGTSS